MLFFGQRVRGAQILRDSAKEARLFLGQRYRHEEPKPNRFNPVASCSYARHFVIELAPKGQWSLVAMQILRPKCSIQR